MKKTMLLISCCSLAILLSVSNATAGEGEKKEPSLPSWGDFFKTKVMKRLEKSGECSRKAAIFYGSYIVCRLATDYVVLPIYKKITSLSKNQNCSCKEKGKNEEGQKQPPVLKGNGGYWRFFPFPRRK